MQILKGSKVTDSVKVGETQPGQQEELGISKMASQECKKNFTINVTDPPSNIEWNVDMKVNMPNVKTPLWTKIRRIIIVFLIIIASGIYHWKLFSIIQDLRNEVIDVRYRNEKLLFQIIDTRNLVERLNFHFDNLIDELNEHLAVDDFDQIVEIPTEKKYNEGVQNENDKKDDKNDEDNDVERYFILKRESNDVTKVPKANKAEARIRRSLINPSPRRNNTMSAQLRLGSNAQGDDLDNLRTTRMRRDEGRGKKRSKRKRRPKRSRGRLGPLMATFVGAVPEQHVIDSAKIGPWVKTIKNESRYSFNKFHLVDDRKAIEVTVDGLYMISTQIYYFGEYTHHSYWVLLNAEGASASQKLVKCAAVSALSDREVSCYSNVVKALNRGDRIYIQQQERNRLINLREGYSHIQFVLLSTDIKRRF